GSCDRLFQEPGRLAVFQCRSKQSGACNQIDHSEQHGLGFSVCIASRSGEAGEIAMNWYRENRWLGNFLIAFGLALVVGLWFLFYARGSFADTMTEFNAAATERSRLEHLNS